MCFVLADKTLEREKRIKQCRSLTTKTLHDRTLGIQICNVQTVSGGGDVGHKTGLSGWRQTERRDELGEGDGVGQL
jgi:hypothetical protein